MKKKLIPSENADGKLLTKWLLANGYFFVHIPNEIIGMVSHELASHLRSVGVGAVPGAPDYMIVLTRSRQVAFIELKRCAGGVVSPAQHLWLDTLTSGGTPAKVCEGFFAARQQIEDWENG